MTIASYYPAIYGYNYSGECVKNKFGNKMALTKTDATNLNVAKLLSYIPVINNIFASYVLYLTAKKTIEHKYLTAGEKAAYMSRWIITSTGFGFVFIPIDIVATYYKILAYNESHDENFFPDLQLKYQKIKAYMLSKAHVHLSLLSINYNIKLPNLLKKN